MLSERLGQLGGVTHLAALLREWAGTAAIDDATGLPLDAELLRRHEEVRGRLQGCLEDCRTAEFMVELLEEAPRCQRPIRQGLAAARYPFVGVGPLRCAGGGEVSEVEGRASQLVALARLVLPAGPLDAQPTLSHLLHVIRETEETIGRLQRGDRGVIQEELLGSIIGAGRDLGDIHEYGRRLLEQLSPIGERYLAAFAEYIVTVVESLLLKLEITELEAKLQVLEPSLLLSLRTLERESDELHAAIGRITQQREAQLCLFHQLGPAVTKIAHQYQQILSQIELVSEDLAQLR